MKRSFTYIALLFLLLCSPGCSLNFQDFSAPDGSYSVKMPGKPVKSVNVGAGATGESWEVLTSNWNFAVATVDLPPSASSIIASQPGIALDGGVQGMVSHMRATNKGTSSITLNGFPGKEVEVSLPAGPNPSTGKNEPASTAVVRIYLVNTKIVMLMARCRNTITKDSPDVKTFFDSFKLNATASSPAGGMAGMPGGSMPMGGAGMNTPSATYNGAPSSTPNSGAMATPGYAGANGGYSPSGGSPMPNNYAGSPMPNNYAGSPMPNNYSGSPMPNNNSGSPMPNNYAGSPMPNNYAGSPMPNNYAGSPMANGSYAPSNGASPMPMPMPSATYSPGNNTAGAGSNGTYPPPAGTATGPGYNTAGANGTGANSYGGPGGQPGAGPSYTGTPVTDETKLTVGDTVQVQFNNQWIDVKIQRISPNGMVQVRTLTKPPVINAVPRSMLQLPPGSDEPEVASDEESPRTSPGSLPSSKGGLPSSTAAAKPRATGFSKPSADPKPETSKSSSPVSLDGATVEELLTIVGKKSEHRRVQAAEKLREHRDAGPNQEVADKLLKLLETDQLTVRNAVAQALEKWATPEINVAALKNLKGGTTEMRQSMMRILAANYVEGNAEGIAQCLANQDDRKVAAETLTTIGEPAQGAVLKMLSHRDSKVKVAACDILTAIGSAESVEAFKKATADWTGTDRLAARKTLKALEAKK